MCLHGNNVSIATKTENAKLFYFPVCRCLFPVCSCLCWCLYFPSPPYVAVGYEAVSIATKFP